MTAAMDNMAESSRDRWAKRGELSLIHYTNSDLPLTLQDFSPPISIHPGGTMESSLRSLAACLYIVRTKAHLGKTGQHDAASWLHWTVKCIVNSFINYPARRNRNCSQLSLWSNRKNFFKWDWTQLLVQQFHLLCLWTRYKALDSQLLQQGQWLNLGTIKVIHLPYTAQNLQSSQSPQHLRASYPTSGPCRQRRKRMREWRLGVAITIAIRKRRVESTLNRDCICSNIIPPQRMLFKDYCIYSFIFLRRTSWNGSVQGGVCSIKGCVLLIAGPIARMSLEKGHRLPPPSSSLLQGGWLTGNMSDRQLLNDIPWHS